MRQIIALLLLAGLAAVLVYAPDVLSGRPRFRVDPGAIRVDRAASWMDDDTSRRVALRLGALLGPPASLVSDSDLRAWAARLGQDPWVAEVVDVRPDYPYRARVELRMRRPMMEVDGVLWSADGVALGEGGALAGQAAPLRFLGVLDDEAVLECAAACGELAPWRRELALAGLELRAVTLNPAGLVTFITDIGVELIWGRSRRSPLALVDMPVAGRVDNLMKALESHPGLVGIQAVELHLDEPVVYGA